MRIALTIASALTVTACTNAHLVEFDYLGQDPPGREPVLFAPGIVSTEHREHGIPVFSPDGREVYFSRQREERHDIMWARRSNGVWTSPEPVPFTSDALDDGPGFFPVDGRLFFGSRRPAVAGGEELDHTDIWYVEREGNGWGQPTWLDGPLNTDTSDGFPCFTADGTMYFHSERGGDSTLADIYRARWNGESFDDPERLPAPVNSSLYEAGPYVAPDESYLIYMQVDFAHPDTVVLNLSFRIDEQTWAEPIDLAAVLDLPRTDILLGRVSPDQKYLFVLASGDVFWVDADVIEELREP